MKTKLPSAEDNPKYILLWEQSQRGNKAAFCTLAEDHYRTLFNYAVSFTSDHDLIKDTIQELYLHLWENRERIQISQVSIYLLRSVRNKLISYYRLKRSFPLAAQEEMEDESDGLNSELNIISQEIIFENESRIQWALNKLPKRQKEVIFLKYYQGLDNDQIAAIMDISRQSIANLLHKALTSLRQYIPYLSHLAVLLGVFLHL